MTQEEIAFQNVLVVFSLGIGNASLSADMTNMAWASLKVLALKSGLTDEQIMNAAEDARQRLQRKIQSDTN